MLAPRINAAGRMSTPDIALAAAARVRRGMLDEARALAEQLNLENERRQQEERGIVAEARKRWSSSDPDIGARSVLVVAGDGWHRGVIGIVASKLVDAFHRPAIVIAIDGETAHGSCRSIPGFDMLAALDACAAHLERFGGHKLAAGLTLGRSRIHGVPRRADARGPTTGWGPTTCGRGCASTRRWVPPDHAERFYEALSRLAPFGAGNPRPVFWTAGAR